jgi:DNA-binding CsgD family transcriptional regulator
MPFSTTTVPSGRAQPPPRVRALRNSRSLPEPASPPRMIDTHENSPVNALLGAIYDGPLESTPWRGALQLLQAALQATHVTLTLRPPSSGHSGVMVHTGADIGAKESYEKHFFTLDPFVRLQEGEVVSADELLGRQWLETPIYQDYLRPLDVRHVLGADLYTREGIECRLRATRGHASSAFSDADKALCRFLLPHLKRAIQLHARLDSLECERQVFAGTVNRMLVGMIYFSQGGEILEINLEARRILAEKDGLSLAGNNLTVDSAQESRQLQRILQQSLHGTTPPKGPGMAEAMLISRPSGRSRLSVLVREIPLGEWSESRQRPAVAVFVRDPESNPAQSAHELARRLFGLTRVEATLALRLAEGFTLDEVSEQMNIRRNTARTHLRSIFCKTGVQRQTMLVRLLLNSVIALA